MIANVSLLSSFQLTTPPDKLFKDISFCLLFLSKRDTYMYELFIIFFYFLVSQTVVRFELHVKGEHDCF